jgi:hypothetical protein
MAQLDLFDDFDDAPDEGTLQARFERFTPPTPTSTNCSSATPWS